MFGGFFTMNISPYYSKTPTVRSIIAAKRQAIFASARISIYILLLPNALCICLPDEVQRQQPKFRTVNGDTGLPRRINKQS